MKSSDTNTIDSTGAPMTMPRSLQVFVRVALSLLASAATLEAMCGYMYHAGAPYNSPLLHDYFPDLLTLWPRFQHFHTLQFFTDTQDPPYMYPAPVAVCYRTFFTFVPHELRAFLSFVLLCAVVATFLFGRTLISRGLSRWATILLMSFALTPFRPLRKTRSPRPTKPGSGSRIAKAAERLAKRLLQRRAPSHPSRTSNLARVYHFLVGVAPCASIRQHPSSSPAQRSSSAPAPRANPLPTPSRPAASKKVAP